MALHLKRFGGLATASESSVFFSARLKLTGIYVLILGLILLGFSTILYQSLERNLVDASEDNFADAQSHHHFVQNTLSDIGDEIIIIDIIIIVVAAGVSYVLAGYTLLPIQRSLGAQMKFSENASHELRTPIAVMKNDTEVLLRNPNPTKEHIQTTLRSNIEEMDRMTHMTEDLLLLARSQNNTNQSETKNDLAEIVRTIAENMRPLVEKKGISLSLSSTGPLVVQGYKPRLERVFTNLLQNAFEHTVNGDTISIDVLMEGSEALVKISDTGSGIEEKDLPHLFERFYKGESATGSGLGLSIVKELLNQHNGSIDITSVSGDGTTVVIKVPLST